MLLFNIKKDICTSPFLDAQELHYWNTLKASVCIFLYIYVRTFLFQRRSKIYLMRGGLREDWKISLRRFPDWVSFVTSIYSIKTLKFSRKLWLNGKIVAKVLIKSHFLSIWNNVTIKYQIKHGPFKKCVICIMTFSITFNFVTPCNFTVSFPLFYSLNFTK